MWLARKKREHKLPPIILQGERLFLRPPAISDWQQWSKVRARNQEFLTPFEPSWPENCLNQDFFEKRLKKQTNDWYAGRSHSFLIFENKNAALIGGININNVNRGAAQQATLGYWLDHKEQGNGFMTEALSLIIDFGFDELDLHRFNAGCLLDNEKSRNLLLRVGFEEEGLARKYVKINGKWRDHRLFGLPVESWRSSASK